MLALYATYSLHCHRQQSEEEYNCYMLPENVHTYPFAWNTDWSCQLAQVDLFSNGLGCVI